MNYPIPDSTQEIMNWQQKPVVDEEMVAAAIAGVIKIVSSQGQSLDELTAQVLADDPLLSKQQRRWLSQVVTQAWDSFA
ncbi:MULTISPECIES: hypothetical protein [Mastigocoleus]|uniref:Uncharacterized protein n=1 Tax=Mastigocoleus testarum BC008 TaxID=371196 RepID=A0A0V7ZQ88_9CYAN|nr:MULTISPECIES: hypothetical protein [Mastigocoleus]KST66519.1 hypothetical protein BC008_43095 [Mastigocoleus testarum BC008]MDJ0693820.1 hypothetical protein [Mastigocoleus sp. MO_188.B34]MDJ0772552.1 hypothetical protein [Mastigocoleus sp. MO_167.B18]